MLLLATEEGLLVANDDVVLDRYFTSSDFLALAQSPSAPGVAYAGTTKGQVYRSSTGGRTWPDVGRIEGFGELSSLAVDPREPNWLWAGMEPAALLRSRDAGHTWEEIEAIRAMSQANGWSVPWSDAPGHVRRIAIDPNDANRVYLAIEVGGVVRTEDGETWENVRGQLHDDVHSVAVHTGNGAILYAATRHGFGRSEDYGRTWIACNPFEGQGYSRPLAVDPANPERLFTAAATIGPQGFQRPTGSECGIYRSTDGGRSWAHLTDGLPHYFGPYVDAMDVDPADPDHVVLADRAGDVYVSRDGGNSWRPSFQAPPVRRLIITP